jgi:hypothetical protein
MAEGMWPGIALRNSTARMKEPTKDAATSTGRGQERRKSNIILDHMAPHLTALAPLLSPFPALCPS